MSLNPLTIAHLGIARRPIVAALLGLWDEIMQVLSDDAAQKKRGGAGGGKIPMDPYYRQRKFQRQRAAEEVEITAIINILASQGLFT